MSKKLNFYSAEDLIPEQWYYCEYLRKECQYFMFVRHNYKPTEHTRAYLIKGIDGREYWGYYPRHEQTKEMTPKKNWSYYEIWPD
jgi:hypothetical protein